MGGVSSRELMGGGGREPKWMSAVKLLGCFVVIQLNSSLFSFLRDRILARQFPSALALVFASQAASLAVAGVVCAVRRRQFAQQASASGGASGIRK